MLVKLCDRLLKPGDVVKRIGSKDGQLGYCRSISSTCYAQVVGTEYVLTNVNVADVRPLKWSELICWINVYHVVKVVFTSLTMAFWFHICTFNEYSLIVGFQKSVTMKDSYEVIPLEEWKAKMTSGLKQSPTVLKQSPTRTASQKMVAFEKNIFYYGFAFLWLLTISIDVYKKFVLIFYMPRNLSHLGHVGSCVEYYCLLEICEAIVYSIIQKKVKLKSVICFYSIYGIVLEIFKKLQWNVTLEENNLSEIWNECLGILILCCFLCRTFMVLKTVWRKGLPRSMEDLKDLLSGKWESELFPGKMLVTELLNTQTRVEVVWQDGTVEHDILSVNLHPVKVSWDMHEFFPGDRVLRSNDSVTDIRPYAYGVVSKVDHRSRIAMVIWLKTNSEAKLEVMSVQETSVYDINYHPDFKYLAGSDLINFVVPEPTAEDVNANEGDPITTTDQSPPEDHSLLPQGDSTESESESEWEWESENWAFPKSSLPSKLATEADEEQPVGVKEQPVSEERNETTHEEPKSRTNENLLEEDKKQEEDMKLEGDTKQVVDTKQQKDVQQEKDVKREGDTKQERDTKQEDGTKKEDNTKQEDDTEEEDTSEEESLGQGLLLMLDSVPDSHKFKLNIFEPKKFNAFLSIVKKEMDILKSSLPDGIIVKGFADRIDLYSVLIKGPKKTPYEDGLFFFDFQLPSDYPESPPLCHYVSFCTGRLNPNLYEGGRVCISLLGTWPGKDTEKWNKNTSNLLQVVVSIQGLILVSEPYYNESIFVREQATCQEDLGQENSRLYNEMVVLRLMETIINLIENPPELFQKEVSDHFKRLNLVKRLERWVEISESWSLASATSSASLSTLEKFHRKDAMVLQDEISLPDFPLMPASKGFCFSLRKSLDKFKNIVASQKS